MVDTTGPATADETARTPVSFRADMTIQKAGLGLIHKVKTPGAGPAITIEPGQTAFAGVKWAGGDKASTSTYVATSIELTPSGASRPVNVNIIDVNGRTDRYTEFDLTSVQVGSLQPAAQGVLVF